MSEVVVVGAAGDPGAEALVARLRAEGFQVVAVEGAEALRESVRTREPDAVVLAGLDGGNFCRDLRADPGCGRVPMLRFLLTAEAIERALDDGADDVALPGEPTRLVLARLKRLAGVRQRERIALRLEKLAQVGRVVAGIVHEIRAPLTVIRGTLELVRLRRDDLAPDLRTAADAVITRCEALQSRLDQLMAAVRTGPIELREAEIGPIVLEAIDYFAKSADLRANRIDVAAEVSGSCPKVQVDAGRLLQVLLNLLTNAREAIGPDSFGGKILVKVGPGRSLGREGLAVEVRDNGPGIGELTLARVFEPSFTTKAEGTGFGLYLAREIAREHGGNLSASNLEDGGVSFTLWLPRTTVEAISG